MKAISSLLTIAVLSVATALSAAPASAVPDIGFLPQCPAGSMFGILAGKCIPYDPDHPNAGSQTRGDGRNVNPPAPPSTPAAPLT